MKALARFSKAEDGIAALHFALIMLTMLLFILGTLEAALTIFVSSTLESAVLAASRYGVTGFTNGTSREDRIREIIDERTFGLVDMSTINISIMVYPTFADMNTAQEQRQNNNGGGSRGYVDPGVAGVGGPGDIVLYNITYMTNGFTGLLRPLFGQFLHRATVAVRNEPF